MRVVRVVRAVGVRENEDIILSEVWDRGKILFSLLCKLARYVEFLGNWIILLSLAFCTSSGTKYV